MKLFWSAIFITDCRTVRFAKWISPCKFTTNSLGIQFMVRNLTEGVGNTEPSEAAPWIYLLSISPIPLWPTPVHLWQSAWIENCFNTDQPSLVSSIIAEHFYSRLGFDEHRTPLAVLPKLRQNNRNHTDEIQRLAGSTRRVVALYSHIPLSITRRKWHRATK